MNRTTITATAVAAFMLLAGCKRPAPETRVGDSSLEVFRDAGTGCEYVGFSGVKAAAITPRMNQDGTQVCGGARP